MLISRRRDEAASAVAGDTFYILGGIGQKSVERMNFDADGDWTETTSLPDVVARGCAVAIDSNTIVIVGMNTSSYRMLMKEALA